MRWPRPRPWTWCALVLGVLLWAAATPATAAEDDGAQTREQLLRILELKEAELALTNAQNAHEQKEKEVNDLRKLFTEDAVTGKEVRQAELELATRKQDLEAAQLRLEKTRLSFIESAIHIALVDASKTVKEAGDRQVTVTLKNKSDLTEALTGQPPGTTEGEVIPFLTIENLYVRLEQGGTVVGYPYQTLVDRLTYGQTATLSFDLKQDVDNLSVVLAYHGREETLQVYLARSQAGGAKVRMKSSQFSQTAGTGGSAAYKFTLERLEEAEMVLALDAVGLPEGYKLRFLDEARNPLTQVRLLRGVTALNLTAEVTVPENLGTEDLGQKISFFILAATQTQFETFAAEKTQHTWDANSLTEQGLAFERLELVPKGVGELELRFESLDITRMDKETFTFEGTLYNQGTGALQDSQLIIEKPTGWEAVSEPRRIARLTPGGNAKFVVKVTPDPEAPVGTYDIKLKARSEEEGTTVESSQKSLRITLEAKANTGAIAVLVVLALGLVVGLMVYTVRLSKR